MIEKKPKTRESKGHYLHASHMIYIFAIMGGSQTQYVNRGLVVISQYPNPLLNNIH